MSSFEAAASPPDGVTPNYEHPEDVLRTVNFISNILCIVLVAPFVLIRIYIRVKIVKSFGREDWTCVAAWIGATLFCITSILQSHFGGGFHEWEISTTQLRGFRKSLYADTLVYGPTAYLTKATLLLIYCRVFAPYNKTVIFIYSFIISMLGYYVPILILKIRICSPIAGYWDPAELAHGSCLDQNAIFVADTVMSAVTDLAVLIIPIPLVWSLQMSFKKKLRIVAILGAGGIATGASIVRLILAVHQNSTDQTVQFTRFNLLGTAEIGIGIICACLPAFNILFTRYVSEYATKKSQGTPTNFDVELGSLKMSDQQSRRAKAKVRMSYVELGSDKDKLFSITEGSLKTEMETSIHEGTAHVIPSEW